MLRKSIKDIVRLTNQEFSRGVRDKLPFLGSFLIVIFAVIALVYTYLFSFALGIIVTPGVLALSFWGLLLLNNIYHYWRP